MIAKNCNISVIIPVYNVEKYLSKCLDSVLEQDFDSFEIIAVNDGSTDSCGEILKEYAAKNENILVVEQENQGLGGARNTGIEKATGDYLLFIDSDDVLKPGTLSGLYHDAVQTGADIVWCGMDFVDEAGNVISTRQANDQGVRVATKEEDSLLYANDSYAWNKLYKKDLFIKHNIRFPDRAWYEDLRTLPKLVLQSDKIALTDRICFDYLQRADSIMHVPNTARNVEMIHTVSEVLEYYKQEKAFEKHYESLEYMTVLHVLVFATLRVAAIDPKHPLLKQFHDFVCENFPDYQRNAKIKTNFSFRHKIVFAFSKRKMYRMLYWLDKLNKLR